MKLARVTGKIWSTIKSQDLNGLKFLAVKELYPLAEAPLIVAVDTLDAGIGEVVIIAGGSSARTKNEWLDLPIDAIVIAVVDDNSITEEDINV